MEHGQKWFNVFAVYFSDIFQYLFKHYKTSSLAEQRCSPIDDYPSNSMIESSNIKLFQNDPQQIIVGSTVTLRCEDNYEFDTNSKGSFTVRCQNDGTWTAMPSCKCK